MEQNEQLKQALQEVQDRLDVLKSENPREYERLLKEFTDALEEFNQNLRSIA